MCRFRVNRRPIRRIFHRFQNVPASCERSLIGIRKKETLSNDILIPFEEFEYFYFFIQNDRAETAHGCAKTHNFEPP